jgi:hypothetical protein
MWHFITKKNKEFVVPWGLTGIPHNLEREVKTMKGQSFFTEWAIFWSKYGKSSRWCTWLVQLTSQNWWTWEIKKSWGGNEEVRCIAEYNKYMEYMDRADQYLSDYSVLRKTVKWSSQAHCMFWTCSLQCIFQVQTLNQNQNAVSKNLGMEFGGCGSLKSIPQLSPVQIMCDIQWRNQCHGGLNRNLQATCHGTSTNTDCEKKLLKPIRERRTTSSSHTFSSKEPCGTSKCK